MSDESEKDTLSAKIVSHEQQIINLQRNHEQLLENFSRFSDKIEEKFSLFSSELSKRFTHIEETLQEKSKVPWTTIIAGVSVLIVIMTIFVNLVITPIEDYKRINDLEHLRILQAIEKVDDKFVRKDVLEEIIKRIEATHKIK